MNAAPLFVVTVDVEDFFEPRPPCDTYFARIGGEEFGVARIMDLLEHLGGRGTFFVDVYNRRTVDEELIERAVRQIHERGHEVGLHTHPDFPEGKRGYGMAQTMQRYDLPHQIEIIRAGAALIEKWTGAPPVSHRAGGYGANYDTLRALAACGIAIDSSVLHGYRLCGLNDPPLAVNRPARWEGVLEMPISVAECRMTLGASAGAPRLASLVKKIDPDWASPGEMRRQIAALAAEQVSPILIFLHSYSFLDLERGFRPNQRAIAVVDDLLRAVTQEFGGKLVTLADAAARIAPPPAADLRPPPIVQSDLAWRDRELTAWLARKVRPRHVAKLLDQRG